MSRDLATNARPLAARPLNANTRSVSRVMTSSSAASSQSSSFASGSDVTNQLTDGITGNAMTVPPPKAVVLSVRPDNSRPRGSPRRSITASKSESLENESRRSLKEINDRNRELKDALVREKQQVSKLQQLIERLQAELENAQQCNDRLQGELKEKEKDFWELLEKERLARQQAEKEAEQKNEQLQEKEVLLSQYCQQVSDLKSLITKQENDFANMKADKDREIATRDVKLDRLKQQMAEALQGNSWQRQQQLDELNKELMKVQEEADVLRSTLRSTNKNACGNCEKLSSKLSKLEVAATAGDRTITDLKQLIAAYEKQLPANESTQRSAVLVSKSTKQHSK